jgi:methylthioribose-1-phosphate isomerase
MNVAGKAVRTVDIDERGAVWLIEQNRLPWRFERVALHRWRDVAAAIRDMLVRGAGAIGATGAAGVACAAVEAPDDGFTAFLADAAAGLRATRPTAQNLFAGIDAVMGPIEGLPPAEARPAAIRAARAFCDADAAGCEAIGRFGAPLIRDGARVSTHCNAGWLAFVDWGSALSPIYAAHRAGRSVHVWVDETRPRGQGARLTAWELGQEGVKHTVITDGVVGSLMRRGLVDLVIVGSDRIAANGDVANKIGTYSSAVLAKAHGIPFYVAAPTTTIDHGCPTGAEIPIEERSADEVAIVEGPDGEGVLRRVRIVSPGSVCLNPAFDVTPGELIAGIITERGIVAATRAGIASIR